MAKLSKWWDWLLPELIFLCPMGAMAYYNATAETEAAHPHSERARRRSVISTSVMGAAVIPVARV
ncbi:MAG TPA: hypothetical protein VK606_10015 [Verrucomicrobiae bacterium]|nr:hypothetical protein [Verrucomicrobiae bacterium]